jgi:hypothetical protein
MLSWVPRPPAEFRPTVWQDYWTSEKEVNLSQSWFDRPCLGEIWLDDPGELVDSHNLPRGMAHNCRFVVPLLAQRYKNGRMRVVVPADYDLTIQHMARHDISIRPRRLAILGGDSYRGLSGELGRPDGCSWNIAADYFGHIRSGYRLLAVIDSRLPAADWCCH